MSTHEKGDSAIAVADDWSSTDRRQYERYEVDFYLRVTETPSNVRLGEVIDISLSGMQLLRPDPIPPNQQFHCAMEASLESGQQIRFPFACRSVWCRRDEISGAYNAGFEFIDPTLALEEHILQIIQELS